MNKPKPAAGRESQALWHRPNEEEPAGGLLWLLAFPAGSGKMATDGASTVVVLGPVSPWSGLGPGAWAWDPLTLTNSFIPPKQWERVPQMKCLGPGVDSGKEKLPSLLLWRALLAVQLSKSAFFTWHTLCKEENWNTAMKTMKSHDVVVWGCLIKRFVIEQWIWGRWGITQNITNSEVFANGPGAKVCAYVPPSTIPNCINSGSRWPPKTKTIHYRN